MTSNKDSTTSDMNSMNLWQLETDVQPNPLRIAVPAPTCSAHAPMPPTLRSMPPTLMSTHSQCSEAALWVVWPADDFRSHEQLDGAAAPLDDAGGGMNKYKINTLEAKVAPPALLPHARREAVLPQQPHLER